MRITRPTTLFAAAGLALAGAAAALPADAAAPSSGVQTGRHAPPFRAQITKVNRHLQEQMIGVSWREGCPVPISDLRVIRMNYWGFDGRVHRNGRLMVHKDVAADVAEAFGSMYQRQFPIRRMELIEKYAGSDDASMAADNTSAFNCRPITGQTGRYSIHSYGKAIDINTVENPYVKGTTVLPPAGGEFLDRTDVRPGMIVAGDATVQAFTERGFDWGGSWTTLKDYQHFEIPQP